jgi:hypothetical protein
MNVGSTSVDRVPALQAGLLSCDATCVAVGLQVDAGRRIEAWFNAVRAADFVRR